MKKSPSVVIVLLCITVIVFGIGFFLGQRYITATLEAKLERAKTLFPSIPEISTLSGTINHIEDNMITFTVSDFLNPLEDISVIREAVITERTRIFRQELKSAELFQKEIDAYQKARQQAQEQAGPLPIPPLPFSEKEVEVGANTLQTGDRITVDANRNIKFEKRFEAVEITILGGLAPPIEK